MTDLDKELAVSAKFSLWIWTSINTLSFRSNILSDSLFYEASSSTAPFSPVSGFLPFPHWKRWVMIVGKILTPAQGTSLNERVRETRNGIIQRNPSKYFLPCKNTISLFFKKEKIKKRKKKKFPVLFCFLKSPRAEKYSPVLPCPPGHRRQKQAGKWKWLWEGHREPEPVSVEPFLSFHM